MRRALPVLLACALLACWGAALALPLPARVGAQEESYLCFWGEDGMTQESFASAYASLEGAGLGGAELVRGEANGFIAATPAYRAAVAVLAEGSLSQLLEVNDVGFTRIERAAVWRTYSKKLWYEGGDWFTWTGSGVERTALLERFFCEEVTLFSAPPPSEVLRTLGTRRLVFRDGGAPAAGDLVGTAVEEIVIDLPYAFSDGVLTLHTAGGVRIVLGVPAAQTLILPDADFADEGALLACTQLTELTVPFAGSAKSSAGSDRCGEFAHLFSDDGGYHVPDTLKRITVTGGSLEAYAFYGCPRVEEITACGIAWQDISRQAFAGCTGLRSLHSPRRSLALAGEFSAQELPCGCTLFTRTDGAASQ